ncbi:uncharacterized protein VTP21DRAFT_10015 [Calcarisporiella thermophila]|uniref:uncharacterized protein n=1 Tax=Calcarisporiella thermophila TaxID=911321 RepID=UPI003742F21E
MAPQTKEQYEKEMSVVREVFDPLSGRMRLIKGSGEVIERPVSRAEQTRIRKMATEWDGMLFQSSLLQQNKPK